MYHVFVLNWLISPGQLYDDNDNADDDFNTIVIACEPNN